MVESVDQFLLHTQNQTWVQDAAFGSCGQVTDCCCLEVVEPSLRTCYLLHPESSEVSDPGRGEDKEGAHPASQQVTIQHRLSRTSERVYLGGSPLSSLGPPSSSSSLGVSSMLGG